MSSLGTIYFVANEIIADLVASENNKITVTKYASQAFYIAANALEMMGVLKKQKEGEFILLTDYPDAVYAIDFLRAHYESIKSDKEQVGCLMWYDIDPNYDTFDEFIKLCLEQSRNELYGHP